ncbi:hypothetical protein [Mycolicibacterium lutetiense]|jgi:hypothetical protein
MPSLEFEPIAFEDSTTTVAGGPSGKVWGNAGIMRLRLALR